MLRQLQRLTINLWQGLPMQRRVSLVASALMVVAAIILVTYFASRPKYGLLFTGLPSSESAKIVEQLQAKRINFELSDNGGTIHIPDNKVHETRLSLASQGMPKTPDTGAGVGFELFDKPTFGMSDFMQKANYTRALQGELARTIMQFEEIKSARVMIVVPEDRLFQKDKREAKASVFLQIEPGRRISDSQAQAIRFLVANGVENLSPNRVSIVDNFGRAIAEDQDINTPSALSLSQQGVVRELESYLHEKAQSMLDQVLGPGQSVVRITADLNFDAVQTTSETFDPKSQVALQETVSSETNTSTSRERQGTAGTTTNTGNNQNENGTASQSETSKENATNQYAVSRTVNTTSKSPGSISRLTVAVFVNKKRPAGGGTASDRTDKELQQIEEVVKQAVGFSQTSGRADSIKVDQVEFVDIFADPANQPKTNIIGTANRWLPIATQVALVVLAGATLFYFRSIVQSAAGGKGVEPDFGQLLEKYETMQQAAIQTPVAVQRGLLTADEVNRLVRENPSSTAIAIKQWMAKT